MNENWILDDFEEDDSVAYMAEDEFDELQQTIEQLDGEDLSDWDREFVDDLFRRTTEYGRRTILTPRQWKHIDRIRETYL